MPLIRNATPNGLEAAGRLFPAGEPVEVPADVAASLLTNPSFTADAEPVEVPAEKSARVKKES